MHPLNRLDVIFLNARVPGRIGFIVNFRNMSLRPKVFQNPTKQFKMTRDDSPLYVNNIDASITLKRKVAHDVDTTIKSCLVNRLKSGQPVFKSFIDLWKKRNKEISYLRISCNIYTVVIGPEFLDIVFNAYAEPLDRTGRPHVLIVAQHHYVFKRAGLHAL